MEKMNVKIIFWLDISNNLHSQWLKDDFLYILPYTDVDKVVCSFW